MFLYCLLLWAGIDGKEVLFHRLGAFGADSLVVELLFIHNVAVDDFSTLELWCFFAHEVNDLAAFLAVEVNVPFYVAVVADPMLIYRNHLRSVFLA